MSLNAEEDEIIDHLQEIARLRSALVMIMCMAELNRIEDILTLVKEALGTE